MNWAAITSGLVGAALLAAGSNMFFPVASGVCLAFDWAGVASMMTFLGLVEGDEAFPD
jgi:hypothetical protein